VFFVFANILLSNSSSFLDLEGGPLLSLWSVAELHKKETCEAVTLIETPPMIVVGLVGTSRLPQHHLGSASQ
jgi:hypothetical protein